MISSPVVKVPFSSSVLTRQTLKFSHAAGILQNEAANGGAGGDLSAANGVGQPVGIAAVRHPTKYASATPNTAAGAAYAADSGADLIIPVSPYSPPIKSQRARLSRVTSHVSQAQERTWKVRVLFGL